MTLRRRTKSVSRAGRAKKPVPVNNQATVASPKRVRPPLVEPFHVAVDRQLKSGFPTFEAAAKAALSIKKLYPVLQVTVYDAKEQRHTIIELPKVAADPHKKSSDRLKRTTFQRRAVAGGRH